MTEKFHCWIEFYSFASLNPIGNPCSQIFFISKQNRYYQVYDCIGIHCFSWPLKLMNWIILSLSRKNWQRQFNPRFSGCSRKKRRVEIFVNLVN